MEFSKEFQGHHEGIPIGYIESIKSHLCALACLPGLTKGKAKSSRSGIPSMVTVTLYSDLHSKSTDEPLRVRVQGSNTEIGLAPKINTM